MTLHKAVEVTKKFLIGVSIGIAAILVFMLLFRLGIIIKNIISPPKTLPPTHLFEALPAISFPPNVINKTLTYDLNTVTGSLPKFPDRIDVFPISKTEPSLLLLDKAKDKIKKIGFVDKDETVLPETLITEERYSWSENTGLGRGIDFNIVTSDFVLESGFLTSTDALNAKQPPDKNIAIGKIKEFLNNLEISTDNIDFEKTKTEFFSIKNGVLAAETNISKAKVTRIDLQQKNIEYSLDTGIPDLAGGYKKLKMSVPAAYPKPPLTNMTFWLASIDQPIIRANFVNKNPDTKTSSTYAIKTADEAFDELKNGKAFIAVYYGTGEKVTINNVYLAYYFDDSTNNFIMPVVVFEGDNGFTAYVSAIRTEWVK